MQGLKHYLMLLYLIMTDLNKQLKIFVTQLMLARASLGDTMCPTDIFSASCSQCHSPYFTEEKLRLRDDGTPSLLPPRLPPLPLR